MPHTVLYMTYGIYIYIYIYIYILKLNHLDILAVKTVVLHIERVAASTHDTAVQVGLKLQGVESV